MLSRDFCIFTICFDMSNTIGDPTSVERQRLCCPANIKWEADPNNLHLCAWGNDAANEVLTEARLLLVENYFQTPSWAWVNLSALENFWKGSLRGIALNFRLNFLLTIGGNFKRGQLVKTCIRTSGL